MFTYLKKLSVWLRFTIQLWQYGLWSFQTGGTKLESFSPKNQFTQKKLFNFENWVSGGLRSFQKSETIIFIFSVKKISQIEIMA
jgi:hypothetical protein